MLRRCFLGLVVATVSGADDLCRTTYATFVPTSGGLDVETVRGDGDRRAYRRTDRPVSGATGQTDWPADWRNLKALKGRRVLDAGCGNGATVNEMIEAGVLAEGVDVRLTVTQKARSGIFKEADLTDTGYPDRRFAVVYSSYSVFLYEADKPAVMEAGLRELKRVTEAGGRIRLAGADLRAVEAAMEKVGGLRTVEIFAEHHGGAPGQPASRRAYPTGEMELEVLP